MSTWQGNPFIGDRLEAALCVTWWPMLLIGCLLGYFVSPVGWALVLVSVIDAAALLHHVARRIKFSKADRRLLRVWLGPNAQYLAVTVR